MTDKNKMSKSGYVVETLFWCALGFWYYFQFVYRNIFEYDYENSIKFLSVIYAVSVLTGVIITFKKRRTFLSVIVNCISSLALYTVITYFSYLYSMILIITVVAMILSVLYIVPFITRKINPDYDKIKRKEIRRKRLRYSFLGARTITALCFSVLIAYITWGSITGSYILQPKTVPTKNTVYSEEYTIKNNINTLKKLKQEEWTKLTIQEKLEVLQVVCNVERNYLGVANTISVKAGALDDNVLGHYEDEKYTVVINSEHLKNSSAESVLSTVTHECYHCYQHRLIDLYDNSNEIDKNLAMFNHVEEYKDEFKNYNSDGGDEYYYQSVEVDARAYAQSAVVDYYGKLEKYLTSQKG